MTIFYDIKTGHRFNPKTTTSFLWTWNFLFKGFISIFDSWDFESETVPKKLTVMLPSWPTRCERFLHSINSQQHFKKFWEKLRIRVNWISMCQKSKLIHANKKHKKSFNDLSQTWNSSTKMCWNRSWSILLMWAFRSMTDFLTKRCTKH